jgi:three-Cys-motif partner protein
MAEPVLWPLNEHTRAKHRILAAYLSAWLPVMGLQEQKFKIRQDPPRLLVVDGFAGPGRYETGEEGSPLIMLRTLLDHKSFGQMKDVEFLFLFIEHDERRVQHLNGELEALAVPENVKVMLEHGEFESTFGEIVEDVHGKKGRTLVPTFAFIDPFGYSHASMSLAGKFLDFKRCEALFFLPMDQMGRFLSRDKQESAMNSLFGNDRWRGAIPLQGAQRREFLLKLFEDQLREEGGVDFVRSFEIRTHKNREYRLVFASGHEKGLALMKRAMWSVDPAEGVRFVAAHKPSGQEVLFTPDSGAVDTGPLLNHLREKFGNEWFTIEKAEEATLLETPFLHDGHLKRKTLTPAKKAGEVKVEPPPGRSGFVRGTRIRFVA